MSAAPVHVESPSRVERDRNVWWASAQIWAGLSIVAMWLAVLAVGISGADFTTTSHSASGDTTGTTVPSVIAVAICALIATVAVAHAAFRRTP